MSVKIFISYTHGDGTTVKDVVDTFAPMERSEKVEILWDKRIDAGSDFWNEDIPEMMNSSDIICLFLSTAYLASGSCIKEKEIAEKLREEKDVVVIPVIVSDNPWLEDSFLKKLLALPTDGHAIKSSYWDSQEKACMDVHNGVRKVVDEIEKFQSIRMNADFEKFLHCVDPLTNAHPRKKNILLEDIFVCPKLKKIDSSKQAKDEYEENLIDGKALFEFPKQHSKIIIMGADQSGKTTFVKKLAVDYQRNGFLPLFIRDKEKFFQGNFKRRIEKAFAEQYESECDYKEISQNKIVLLIDDFHYARNKDDILDAISAYEHVVLVVDDVFTLDLKNASIASAYSQYIIQEYNPAQRDELITKWISLTDKQDEFIEINNKERDEKSNLIDAVLGKALGRGIVPSYPFFVLSIIVTVESHRPFDQEISSQGYCYQALLFFYLKKENVASEDIETYLNFLTHFAYFLYCKKKSEISDTEFNEFFKQYCSEYNFTLAKDKFVNVLYKAQILRKSSLGLCSFAYQYLYYFFAGKFFAEESDEEFKDDVEEITNNLHLDENAYIAIFIAHHTKKGLLPEKLLNLCDNLFKQEQSASLTKDNVAFFDVQANQILPTSFDVGKSEENRQKDLARKNELENRPIEEPNDVLAVDLRRSFKTVEVLGQIIKNRAGSLPKTELVQLYDKAMNVMLRLLSNFLNLIKPEKNQDEIIAYIKDCIEKAERDDATLKSDVEKKERAKICFWNMNFAVILFILDKIRLSLGSEKLRDIVLSVCDNLGTPAAQIVKFENLMWYSKELDVDAIKTFCEDNDTSMIARNAMVWFVYKYASLHRIDYKDASRIKNAFKTPQKVIQKGLVRGIKG